MFTKLVALIVIDWVTVVIIEGVGKYSAATVKRLVGKSGEVFVCVITVPGLCCIGANLVSPVVWNWYDTEKGPSTTAPGAAGLFALGVVAIVFTVAGTELRVPAAAVYACWIAVLGHLPVIPEIVKRLE